MSPECIRENLGWKPGKQQFQMQTACGNLEGCYLRTYLLVVSLEIGLGKELLLRAEGDLQ